MFVVQTTQPRLPRRLVARGSRGYGGIGPRQMLQPKAAHRSDSERGPALCTEEISRPHPGHPAMARSGLVGVLRKVSRSNGTVLPLTRTCGDHVRCSRCSCSPCARVLEKLSPESTQCTLSIVRRAGQSGPLDLSVGGMAENRLPLGLNSPNPIPDRWSRPVEGISSSSCKVNRDLKSPNFNRWGCSRVCSCQCAPPYLSGTEMPRRLYRARNSRGTCPVR